MFLSYLNERESRNFLEIAQHAIWVNSGEQKSKETLMTLYRRETGFLDYQLKHRNLDELIRDFQASTKKSKRVVIIELAGIMDADEIVETNEEQWIMKIGQAWGFRETEIRKMLRWVQDFNDLLQEGTDYINK